MQPQKAVDRLFDQIFRQAEQSTPLTPGGYCAPWICKVDKILKSIGLYQEFSNVIMGGALGAFLSVLLRLRTLEIPLYSGIRRQALHAITRTLFGATAGFVFAALHKGELILSAIEENPYAIFGFSIVAGFSERFLPNIMAQFENQKIVIPREKQNQLNKN